MTAGFTGTLQDRPRVVPDEDDPEKDGLTHWFCRRCSIHPDGKHATSFCGTRLKVPPPPQQGKPRPTFAGPQCVVCTDLLPKHTCKDTK